MANSVNYQHFKTLLNAYEKANPEKNKNACQNAVAEIWKNMKKNYPSFDELRNIRHLMNCEKKQIVKQAKEGIISHEKIQND